LIFLEFQIDELFLSPNLVFKVNYESHVNWQDECQISEQTSTTDAANLSSLNDDNAHTKNTDYAIQQEANHERDGKNMNIVYYSN
jgi:hypothetical protein